MQTCTQDWPEPSGDRSSQFTRDFPHTTFPSVSAESPSSWGTPQSRDSPQSWLSLFLLLSLPWAILLPQQVFTLISLRVRETIASPGFGLSHFYQVIPLKPRVTDSPFPSLQKSSLIIFLSLKKKKKKLTLFIERNEKYLLKRFKKKFRAFIVKDVDHFSK